MAIFNTAIPANSEPVKLGAQRIREMKTTLNSALSQLFDDSLAFLTNWVTGAMLQSDASVDASRAVSANHIKIGAVTEEKIGTGAVTAAKIGDGAISPAKLSEAARHDEAQYETGTYSTGLYTVLLSPAASDYTAGMVVRFKADSVNASGAVNIKVNSLAEKDLFKNVDDELILGDIPSGAVVTAVYDGTAFQITAVAGTTHDRFTFTTATTLSTSAVQVANEAHGLVSTPRFVRWVLVCTDAGGDAGYAQNDEVDIDGFEFTSDGHFAFSGGANATHVYLCQLGSLGVLNRSTGGLVAVTESKWKARCYAQL